MGSDDEGEGVMPVEDLVVMPTPWADYTGQVEKGQVVIYGQPPAFAA